MERKVNWGVLSTAKIGREKVIPAIQASKFSRVVGISSENKDFAKTIADQHGIEKVYDSYEKLLQDPEIEIVYIPLPNHLHVEWAVKALEAGKHVLCEKPIGMNVEDALKLADVASRFPNLKIMEAFMYRFHPQWQLVKSLISEGKIGNVKIIQSHFSYYNIDPENIRNKADIGGGALMDIGCYCISFPRFIYNSEPNRLISCMDIDLVMKTDRMSSGILEFSNGKSSTFTCSTQLIPHQRANILGDNGRIEIEFPVNAPNDRVTHIWLFTKEKSETFVIEPVDQYTLQADYLSQAFLNNTPIEFTLTDSINNMKVIDAMVKSAELNKWIDL